MALPRRMALEMVLLAGVCAGCGCEESMPAGETDSGSVGADAAPLCDVPLEQAHPPPYHVQQSCCDVGEVCNGVVGHETCEGAEGETLCRGVCTRVLTGAGHDVRDTQCHCGRVWFDGTRHHGPGPCEEGFECCRTSDGAGACTPAGACSDCSPPTSHPHVRADCCFSLEGATPCHGVCTGRSCECEPGDGGCSEGLECCVRPWGSEPSRECVPFGECDNGPCPPEASSPDVVVSCCETYPCRGSCETVADVGPTCVCGPDWGCGPEEECCLGPSGEPGGEDARCVPEGECAASP